MAAEKNDFQAALRKMIGRYVAGKSKPAENLFLETYYDHFDKEPAVLDTIPEEEKQQLQQAMEEKILAQINAKPVHRIPVYVRIAAAAVVIGLIGITAFYFINNNGKQPQPAITADQPLNKNDIAPGGNKAILVLADGSTVNLDDTKNNGTLSQNNSVLSVGKIVYNSAAAKVLNAISYNTIQTPTGGEFQVVLADGTKVWLNANSSLRFPTAFSGAERSVELTGEGYFEVAKNASMPFIVHVNDMKVKVLGTHFNIMAYANEPAAKTTLLEGSVQIVKGASQKMLVPGQQAIVRADENIKVREVDVANEVSWKNGYFSFNRDNIRYVMRQLSRWYDMDVQFEGAESTDEYSGKIRRNTKVSEALKVLQLTDVQFKIEGKKVTIIH